MKRFCQSVGFFLRGVVLLAIAAACIGLDDSGQGVEDDVFREGDAIGESKEAEGLSSDGPGIVPDAGLTVQPATIQELKNLVDAASATDLTVMVGNEDGVLWTYSKGNSSPTREYQIWSASKWVSSTVILRLVDENRLSLNTWPQDVGTLKEWW